MHAIVSPVDHARKRPTYRVKHNGPVDIAYNRDANFSTLDHDGFPPSPGFRVEQRDSATRAFMIGRTWHPGCPMALADLRLVTVSY